VDNGFFDPTRLSDLSSLVKIAHGKDGSDVAVKSFEMLLVPI
jgi:hypothetical protein